MTYVRILLSIFILLWSMTVSGPGNALAGDPLPSWNAVGARDAIVAFVREVTKKDSPGYVPPSERIAVFDNDGTLWSEQPLYFQAVFILDRIKAMAAQHPEWKNQEPQS